MWIRKINLELIEWKLTIFIPREIKIFLKQGSEGNSMIHRLETNLPIACIFPCKLRNCEIFWGGSMLTIASFFSLSISIPLLDMINPRSFPLSNPKAHFHGFKYILYFLILSIAKSHSCKNSKSLVFKRGYVQVWFLSIL